MNLYDIADNIRVLADMVEAEGGEFDEQTIADTLDGLEGDLNQKADNIGKLTMMLTRQADACELEAVRLKERATKLRKRSESVTAYLHACMTVAGLKKIESSLFNISVRKVPDVVEIDEELLPPDWFVEKVTERPDKRGILAAIREGQTIRGATLVTDREKLYIR